MDTQKCQKALHARRSHLTKSNAVQTPPLPPPPSYSRSTDQQRLHEKGYCLRRHAKPRGNIQRLPAVIALEKRSKYLHHVRDAMTHSIGGQFQREISNAPIARDVL
mmetsp:Transcript_20913/g.41395  ORF Transcript_20913/g.41395 Transcript_20913/m.41395 type:complete len:106 (+) Transcript_20913:258-575(+)